MSGYLVGPPVFKTGETEYLGLAGSIPVHLRQTVGERIAVSTGELRRAIPSVGQLLQDPRIVQASTTLSRDTVKAAVSSACNQARQGCIEPAEIVDTVLRAISRSPSTLTPVLNASGVVLHTNIGRAPLSQAAIEAVVNAAGYSDLEYDVITGSRASRARGTISALREAIPNAEDVLFVNNGAAALLLACSVMSKTKKVIISRGEMVEIGAGFRLPDLITSTGLEICEVGTTNRTSLVDYAQGQEAGGDVIVKIHPSNFVVRGFTSTVSIREAAGLDLPVIVDIGSGLLSRDPLLPNEPNAADALNDGASLVTFSADKLLGGPQAGIIAGGADAIARIRKYPLTRALRTDKLTVAALEATLRGASTPTHDFLHADATQLLARCQAIAEAVEAECVPSMGSVGGGSAPEVELNGWAVALPSSLAGALRAGTPPIIGRIEKGRLLLDPRCIPPGEDRLLIEGILNAYQNASGGE